MMRFASRAVALAVVFAAGAAVAQAPVKTMSTKLGNVMVDQNGMTIYTFDKDEPGKSNCYNKCAVNWPPLTAGADAKPEGDWTIVDRTDGTKMWAYDGKPVYLWIKDSQPGDVTGDGVGGVWHVIKAGT